MRQQAKALASCIRLGLKRPCGISAVCCCGEIFSLLWQRTTPTRQVIRFYAFCQSQRFLERTIEIILYGLAVDPP
jgi:hypothetical protein